MKRIIIMLLVAGACLAGNVREVETNNEYNLRYGNVFYATDVTADVDSNETLYVAFQACTTGYASNYIPMSFDIASYYRTEVFLYEACTVAAAANTTEFIDGNRTTASTIPAEIYPACSMTYRGTAIYEWRFAGNNLENPFKSPEWLLYTGKWYVIAIVSRTANSDMAVKVKLEKR